MKTLGLDLGIGSVGWCLYETDEQHIPLSIIDLGSYVFDQIEDGKTGETENIKRREKRLMRRQRRRHVKRLAYVRTLFSSYFHKDFLKDVIPNNHLNPFEIKKKGLVEKLSPEELMIALYHYAKYRGFKSNRKSEKSDDEGGKMTKGIKAVSDKLEERRKDGEVITITPYLLEMQNSRKDSWDNRIHNSSDKYNFTVSRELYEEEIELLLNKQIEYGVINQKFKDDYFQIYRKQRSYSEGPASGPYQIDREKIVGKCQFEKDELRAPKDSLSATKFIVLTKLVNFGYKKHAEDKDYSRLTGEQIAKALDAMLKVQKVDYKKLFKTVGISNDDVYRVKDLKLSRKEYIEALQAFKKEKSIPENSYLPEQYTEEFAKYVKEKTYSKVFFNNSPFFYELQKALKGVTDLPESDKELIKKDEFFDDVANIFLFSKDDEKIKNECLKGEDSKYKTLKEPYSEKLIDVILNLNADVKNTVNLSLKVLRKIIPFMESGLTYDKATKEAGYNHSESNKWGSETLSYIPPIDEALEKAHIYLKNPVVKHSLVQMRKVINAAIQTYGIIDDYVVELSRELRHSFDERKSIKNSQLENQSKNISCKNEILEKFPNIKSFRGISRSNDYLLRYKLFKEQNGKSPYTNNPISERDIFGNSYQIDHIIPFSRSFDDSYDNKVLVETKCNQEKKNCTPYEWNRSVYENIQKFLNANPGISFKKKENLLIKDFSDQEQDFLNKDLNDSSYIATLARSLITYYLLPEGHECRSTTGGVTNKLREIWGLSGKTHTYHPGVSYENKCYQARFLSDYHYESFEVNEKDKTITFFFNLITMDDQKPSPVKFEIEKEKKKTNRDLSPAQNKHNEYIDLFSDNKTTNYREYFKEKFHNALGKDINELQEQISGERIVNGESSNRSEIGLYILGKVREQIQEDINKKDRSNDLHHALDAAVIGATNPTLIKRINEYNKLKEVGDELNNQKILSDSKTGEISSKTFPYSDFQKDVLARVYECDQEKLLRILNSLEPYKNNPRTDENTRVLIPARSPLKNIKGPISDETIYGRPRAFSEKKLTRVVSVKKITDKQIESIYDKESGNSAVYKAIKEWFAQDAGSRLEFPKLPKKGTFIKSVRIVDILTPEKAVDLSNGRYAKNSDVIRVDVYRKKDSDSENLYFVPIYYYQISRERIIAEQKKKGVKNLTSEPKYNLMWAQGENGSTLLSSSELKENYERIVKLPLRSFIELEIKGGSKFCCYSGGCTSGRLEVYSLLGDKLDAKIWGYSSDERIYITCSTIKNVKLRNISVLGKIS